MSTMKSASNSCDEVSTPASDLQCSLPMLWAMRLLTRIKGGNEFLSGTGFSDDSLAEALGLGAWVDSDCTKTRLQAMRDRLQSLEDWAARSCLALPEMLASNVAVLGELLGLTPGERNLVAFVTMLHVDPTLENAAMHSGGGDRDALHVTLAHVLRVDVHLVDEALRPRGKLLDSGIVIISSGSGHTLDCRISLLSQRFAEALMLHTEGVADLLGHVVKKCVGSVLRRRDYAHIEDMLAILVPHLSESLRTGRAGVNLLVYGKPGTGKSELARVLAADVGASAFEIASENEDGSLLDGERRLRALRASQSLMRPQQTLLVFDEAEDVFRESTSGLRSGAAQSHKAWMNRMLESNRIPVIWIANAIDDLDPAFVRRFDGVIELGVPPRAQRMRLVERYAGDMVSASDAHRLADCTGVTPALLSRACSVVASARHQVHSSRTSGAVVRLVDSTLRAQGESSLLSDTNALPAYYDPKFLSVNVDIDAIANGVLRHGAARICLYGPPGTGKSALGAWLAQRIERPFLCRKASDILGMFVGQTEKAIARAFRIAKDEGAVLMLDEVDSFLRDRRSGQRNWEVSMVNELLIQMEQFDGVFIASTNLIDTIDQAALRRFDLKLKLDYLRPEQATDLLRVVCNDLGIEPPETGAGSPLRGLDVLTPGDFAAIARRHRFEPFRNVEAVTAALRSECALKEDGKRGRMGFV
jgi:SpoVK/Ycf46/Vps4 family AAA+-type ATPase